MSGLSSFPSLTKRIPKGIPLTHAEGDDNLDKIKSYCEMIAAFIENIFEADGTLAANSVGSSQLEDRSVTEAKLGPVSVFPMKSDAGSTNALVISFTPEITAYQDGQVFTVFVANTNTGATTLRAGSSLAAISIKKGGSLDLEAGDLAANTVAIFVYKSGVFHVLNGSVSSLSSGGSDAVGFTGFQVYEPSPVALPPNSAVKATGVLTSTGANPADGDTVAIASTVYRFKNTMSAAYDVQIGANAAASIQNLLKAIDASGTAGVEYFAGTLAHTTVSTTGSTSTTLLVEADIAGVGGNSIPTTEASSQLSWGGATLTGGVTDTFSTFVHGLTGTPLVDVYLRCVVSDLGFAVGVEIPIGLFLKATGDNPAFQVAVNPSTVLVYRDASSIYIPRFGTILEESWNLVVRARVQTAVAQTTFPAVQITTREPLGAMAYGQDLFYVNYGSWSGNNYLNRQNLTNGNIRLLDPADSGPAYSYTNFAQFKRADSTVDAVFICGTGYFRLPLLEATVWKPIRMFTHGGRYIDKPVHIIESGGSITDIFSMTCTYGYVSVSSISCYRANAGSASLYGSNLDLTSTVIKSADGTAGNVEFRKWHSGSGANAPVTLFQYNPVKKRIYIGTAESNHIHIFKILTSADYKTWYDLSISARASDLQYVKTIGVSGSGDSASNPVRESTFIDFDVDTGVERSIVFCRAGGSYSGSITRVPWIE